jgi:hypothetical protein
MAKHNVFPYYPQFKVASIKATFPFEGSITVATTLRKKHKGKYYLWNFLECHYFGLNDNENIELFEQQLKNAIHHNVYLTTHLGIVDRKMRNHFGERMYRKDINQQPEDERLREGLILKKSV